MQLVHLSDWASQPDVRIKCTQVMTTPAWGGVKTGGAYVAPLVYRAANDDYYTFARDKVTCPECLA